MMTREQLIHFYAILVGAYAASDSPPGPTIAINKAQIDVAGIIERLFGNRPDAHKITHDENRVLYFSLLKRALEIVS